jgi:DNA repair protein RadD
VQVKDKYKLDKAIGEPIYKTCPECESLTYPACKICNECGYEFIFETKLEYTSSRIEVIAENKTWYAVDSVSYHVIDLPSDVQAVKCTYRSGLQSFNELFCLNHTGYARTRAVNVLTFRGASPADLVCCNDFLGSNIEKLKFPKRILIDSSAKYSKVLKYEY